MQALSGRCGVAPLSPGDADITTPAWCSFRFDSRKRIALQDAMEAAG